MGNVVFLVSESPKRTWLIVRLDIFFFCDFKRILRSALLIRLNHPCPYLPWREAATKYFRTKFIYDSLANCSSRPDISDYDFQKTKSMT